MRLRCSWPFHSGVFFTFALAASVSSRAANPILTVHRESPLIPVADVPLPGAAVRFDYQSFDATTGRLYIAHMNDDHLVVFDVRARRVEANLPGFHRVHGVLAVPSLHRVFATATGDHALVAMDSETLRIVGHAAPIEYPDGVAYAPEQKKVFVSDEHGGTDAVVNEDATQILASIPLGGGAGNTVYDPTTGHILVAVHHLNQLVAIDPATNRILTRVALPGIDDPHGIALDPRDGLAFVAGEGNHSLAVVRLRDLRVIGAPQSVGDDPDVLAFDPGLRMLYVSAESGVVTIFHLNRKTLTWVGSLTMPHAHTVAVDPSTHLVYFPLQDVDGYPVMRILSPVSQP